MRLVVATITCRQKPLFKAAADTIVANLDYMSKKPESFLWLVVDEKLWYSPCDARRASLEAAVAGRFLFMHVAPSPSPVRGPGHAVELPDIGNARNSAIRAILDVEPDAYVLWLDDRTLLTRSVLDYASQAASEGKCFCVTGGFSNCLPKQETIAVAESGPHLTRCRGIEALAGCCGMPLQALVDVNGVDELYRGEYFTGRETWCRIERAGYEWVTTKRCRFIQVMPGHSRDEVTASREAHRGIENRKRYAALLESDQVVAAEGYRRS